MRIHALALVVALASPASAQVVTNMTPERIREAIQAGSDKGWKPYSIGGWGIYSTPWSRVAMAASEAQRTYRAFGPENVTPEMVEPLLLVSASAFGAMNGRVINVDAIVIRSDDGTVIQPMRVLSKEDSFSNAYGAAGVGRSLRAWFPLSVISAKNEVRIVFASGREEKARFKPEKIR